MTTDFRLTLVCGEAGASDHLQLRKVLVTHDVMHGRNSLGEIIHPSGDGPVSWVSTDSWQWTIGMQGAPPPMFANASATVSVGSSRSIEEHAWQRTPSINGTRACVKFRGPDKKFARCQFSEEVRFSRLLPPLPVLAPLLQGEVLPGFQYHVSVDVKEAWSLFKRKDHRFVSRTRQAFHNIFVRKDNMQHHHDAFLQIPVTQPRVPVNRWHPALLFGAPPVYGNPRIVSEDPNFKWL